MKRKVINIAIIIALISSSMYIPAFVKADVGTNEGGLETTADDTEQIEFTVQADNQGEYVITKYEGEVEYLDIPSEYEGKKIVGVATNAISNETELKEINVSEGIEFLAQESIYNCENLKRINLPSTMTEYGFGLEKAPIVKCSSLIEIAVSGNNKEIKTVNGILFTKDMKKILNYPAGISNISYTIPTEVEIIYYNCFNYNEQLETVIMPETIKEIQYGAFYCCRNINGIKIPSSCEKIGQFAFYQTTIESIYIPACVKFLNSGALSGMNKLESISVSENNSIYYSNNDILYSSKNKSLELYPAQKQDIEFTIPDGIVSIEMSAIENNRYLETISIPETVEYIGYNNFNSCINLKKVNMPYSITKIEDSCFYNDNITIYGYEGTYPEKYVANYKDETAKIKFSAIGKYVELLLPVGTTKSLDISNKTNNCLKEDINWISSDDKVVVVNEGNITAKGKGTALVIGEYNGYKFVNKITAMYAQISTLSFKNSNVSIVKGRKKSLQVIYNPTYAVDTLTFSSSNNKVATVNKKGVVTAKRAGKAIITVKSSKGKTAKCNIIVKEIHIKKITVAKKRYKIKKGKTKQIKFKVNPKNYTDTLIWKSSNKKVATVSKKGKVSAKKKGKTTITIKSSCGKKVKVKIIVK